MNGSKRSTSKTRKRDSKRYYDPKKSTKTISKGYKDGEETVVSSQSGPDNDPMWYAHTPELLDAAASLPMSNVLGGPSYFARKGAAYIKQHTTLDTIPGLLCLRYEPTFGAMSNTGKGDPTSAVNVAAKNVYSFVRHANSGSVNYDAPDLMLGILAADQVFAAIAMAMRAYGIAMVYDQKNRYTPRVLLTAMGFDPEAVTGNLAQFRYYINVAIARASVIWVPSSFTLVARHFWMNTNIYKDGDDAKSQMYMYVPEGFYAFDATADTTGTSLQYKKWYEASNLKTPEGWFKYITSLLDPITSDEDMGIMFGDMLKAYGKENLYAINQMPVDYIVLPVTDSEVLMQFHNAMSVPNSIETRNIHQDANGNIYEDPVVLDEAQLQPVGNNITLDFLQSNPTPADIMVATRCSNFVESIAAKDSNFAAVVACGSEICTSLMIVTLDGSGEIQRHIFQSYSYASTANIIRYFGMLSKFAQGPRLYYTTTTGTGLTKVYTLEAVHGDMQNYTFVAPEVLKRMHTIAIMSEFNVPLML